MKDGTLLNSLLWLVFFPTIFRFFAANACQQTTCILSDNFFVSSYGTNPPDVSTSFNDVHNATSFMDGKIIDNKQAYSLLNALSTKTVYNAIITTENPYNISQINITTGSSQATDHGPLVALTLKNLTNCLTTSHNLKFSPHNAIVDIRTKVSDKLPRMSCEIQVTAPAAMVFHINVISINVQCASFQLVLTDVGASSRRLINSCDNDIPSELWSFTNVVVMMFVVTLESQVMQVALNFTAVPVIQRPKLEIVFASENRGYIQTPNWDGRQAYPVHMDSWVKVDIPERSTVMVSMAHIDVEGELPTACPVDGVELYLNEISNQSSWTRCKKTSVLPTLYQTHALYVHFYSNQYGSNTGFRLFFSIHNQSALPVRLEDGRWNCSGLNWTDFSDHFSCNLKSDCVGSEDEAVCPYTSDRCAVGQASFENSCYIWQKPSPVMTWKEAFDFCLSRGARLASLNTPAEWKNAISLMSLDDYWVTYVGLLQMFLQKQMYLNAWQWSDGTIAYFIAISGLATMPACGQFHISTMMEGIKLKECDFQRPAHVLCEMEAESGSQLPPENDKPQITFLDASAWENDSKVMCPEGHVTHKFLSCDLPSSCWQRGSSSLCDAPLGILPPTFICDNGFDRVPYTLVCDHRTDCSDGSDEDFCEFASCYISGKYDCGNQQCISERERCDGIEQCVTGVDEAKCLQRSFRTEGLLPPAIVDLDSLGQLVVKPLETQLPLSSPQSTACPDTHFQCPGVEYYCLPVYLRCNGVYDCPGYSDEVDCDTYTCPGLYRCRASHVCLHPHHMCDGFNQCPQHDDELTCGLTCPDSCTCFGLAFICTKVVLLHEYPSLRYLDAKGTGMTPRNVKNNRLLIHLSLADCHLEELDDFSLPNLCVLDLTGNYLHVIHSGQLKYLPNLKTLKLSGNPLTSIFPRRYVIPTSHTRLRYLDLSGVRINTFDPSSFNIFSHLEVLNLSKTGLDIVSGNGFQLFTNLQSVDLRGCAVEVFPPDLLRGLNFLEAVYTDNYKLCCQAMLPEKFNPINCHSPHDEISSCEALLRSDFYRALLAVFAAMALLGNVCSFIYRVFLDRNTSQLGFGAFVIHLNVSDFIMGVYLVMIGVADRVYQGSYLWNDSTWKRSGACQMAGFLSLLASEVSAFIVCLITLDRFLVLRFPFVGIHFNKRSAHIACMLAWAAGITLASVPLLPMTSHWQFYGQTGICIPLPVTRNDYPGHDYSFNVLMGLNFVLLMLIAIGQAFIFWSIRTNSMSMWDSTKRSKDLTIARRLISVAVTDFLCRFPIGLLALLASQGVSIPGEVNVAMAIVVLPVNSALNPFLYTLNTIQERRRRQREARRMKLYLSQVNTTSVKNLEPNAGIKNVMTAMK